MSKKRDSLLNPADAKRFGLSEEYWERVGPEGRDMYFTIRPCVGRPTASTTTFIAWKMPSPPLKGTWGKAAPSS